RAMACIRRKAEIVPPTLVGSSRRQPGRLLLPNERAIITPESLVGFVAGGTRDGHGTTTGNGQSTARGHSCGRQRRERGTGTDSGGRTRSPGRTIHAPRTPRPYTPARR